MATEHRGWRGWLSPVLYLSSNAVSAAGVVLVTAATVAWLAALFGGPAGHGTDNPYLGILLFVVLPGIFFLGLALIPLGIWLRWRKEGRGGLRTAEIPSFSLSNPRVRRFLVFLGVTTFLNVIIASHLSYSALGYMDSTTFCGLTCHTVMAPEYTAYQNSPHSRVHCVQCHIGPGASWFVKSKLSGAHQVLAVALGNYERPIPTPVENLRPARDTCEGCHWPDRFGGDRLRVVTKYAEDEANTRTMTVLMMHIGGARTRKGIHGAHVGPGVNIRYAPSDRTRQTIPWIEVAHDGQDRMEYLASGAKVEDVRRMEVRTMDCVDCHNRPTHTYELPERGMDRVLSTGEASSALPFLKKKGLELLKAKYSSRDEALQQIPARLEAFYRERHPGIYKERLAEVQRSGKAVASVYERNVFPNMKVEWGTYPNNVGHTDFNGCFRCHDDEHKNSGGKAVTQDCSTCHEMLATDEADPKILSDLGLKQ